jgi:hypothetical protein
MLNDSDFDQMQADLLVIRDDDPVGIILRRGSNTLPIQMARVVKASGARRMQSAAAGETRAGMIVLGDSALDIAIDDRFTLNGQAYRITFVRPNRTAATMADAEMIE